MTASDGRLNSDDTLFWQVLAVIEEEQKMRYVTSVERIGYERGIKDGEISGQINGQIKILARQITKSFGLDIEKSFALLQKLNSDDLLEFSDMLFDFDSPEAVHRWMHDRVERQTEQ